MTIKLYFGSIRSNYLVLVYMSKCVYNIVYICMYNILMPLNSLHNRRTMTLINPLGCRFSGILGG